MVNNALRRRQIFLWRLSCLLAVVALHSWAATAIPEAPISSPAGQQVATSLALQFSPSKIQTEQLTADKSSETTQSKKPVVQKTPAAQKPIAKAALSKPILRPQISSTEKPEELENTEHNRLIDTSLTTKQTEVDNNFDTVVASATAAKSVGAHREPVLTETIFHSPPTPPRYPTVARKRGQQGTVWLEVWLDSQGQQTQLSITKSSGFKTLDNSAMKAVAKWKFTPLQRQGMYIASRMHVPVEFSLQ